MEELCGVIDKIVYTSPDRVFSVFKLSEKESGRHITVTGSLGVPTQAIEGIENHVVKKYKSIHRENLLFYEDAGFSILVLACSLKRYL